MAQDLSKTASHKLVPTHCAFCGRPLSDAVSLEMGVGPICSKKYYEDAPPISDKVMGQVTAALLGVEDVTLRQRVQAFVNARNSQKAANLLIYHIAILQKDPKVFPMIRALRAMGYVSVADRIEARFKPQITITSSGDGRLTIESPFNEGFVRAVKTIPGRKFDWNNKTWSIPEEGKAALWQALRDHYEGVDAMGPKGPFQI